MMSLSALVQDDCTFVDIGANIGIYSALMSRFKHLYLNFEVISFEVNPDTFSRLECNAERHGFCAYNVGIGSALGNFQFTTGAVSHVTTRTDLSNSYNIKGECFIAEVKTLEDFHISNDLIMKIDVEGQEMDVLLGAKSYFDRNQVKSVYLDGFSDRNCWTFLSGYGFTMLDGRTLGKADHTTFSLLAIRPAR